MGEGGFGNLEIFSLQLLGGGGTMGKNERFLPQRAPKGEEIFFSLFLTFIEWKYVPNGQERCFW